MQPLKLIKINSTGPLVSAWQFFLTGQGFYKGEVNGKFDSDTKQASIDFQNRSNLQPDGIVGNKTFGVAMQLGFQGVEDDRKDKSGAGFPPAPDFLPLTSTAARQKIFGVFTFVPEPTPSNPENIRITNNWVKENIVSVKIPQLKSFSGRDSMQFHKLAADQLSKLWKDWEKAGLLHQVLSFDGSFVSRFVRGLAAKGVLSNHAFGSAFDINFLFNKLGAIPALVGQKGSVRELVPIANENGFYWGGHFSRLDGMHFEIAKILNA
jgi:D-alanyl-D-alanine carboxypeptidase/Putative peptidoglycan binding domain